MTDPLDTLRPEVREELIDFDSWMNSHEYHEGVRPRRWFKAIRAELLRLAEDLHYANGVASLAMQHRDAAEAELAALKARIAEAPVATLVISSAAGDLTLVWAENPDDWASKRVRLVVEE